MHTIGKSLICNKTLQKKRWKANSAQHDFQVGRMVERNYDEVVPRQAIDAPGGGEDAMMTQPVFGYRQQTLVKELIRL